MNTIQQLIESDDYEDFADRLKEALERGAVVQGEIKQWSVPTNRYRESGLRYLAIVEEDIFEMEHDDARSDSDDNHSYDCRYA